LTIAPTVGDELGAQATQVFGDIASKTSDDVRSECRDRGDDNLVAATDREAQGVAIEARLIGAEHGVGRRVIRVRIHRVRPIMLQRCREAHVDAVERDDPRRTGRPADSSRWHRPGRLRFDLRHVNSSPSTLARNIRSIDRMYSGSLGRSQDHMGTVSPGCPSTLRDGISCG